jgi:glutathione peroxidase
MPRYLGLSLLACMLQCLVHGIPADTHAQCASWAEQGECEANPGYMRVECATACAGVDKMIAESLEGVDSFYDLSANQIVGPNGETELVKFDVFRDKVVIIVNVASYCGYTESHYKGLVELYSKWKDSPVEILAFPCNQFGKQEPKSLAEIQEFAKDKGVEFRMFEKINVNGPQTHPVYLYLKRESSSSAIQWNFATYFVVSPGGDDIQAHAGVEPMELQPLIAEMLGQEEL